MSLYLTRLRKRRAPDLETVGRLLDPNEPGRRMDADHRLLWSLFAGAPDARRDFLWRAEGRDRLLVLSQRPPGHSPFFEPPETRSYAPDLAVGDQLAFALRANATRDRAGAKRKNRRVDVVMDALHAIPPEERAACRADLTREAAEGWLTRQGIRNGFAPIEVSVQSYDTLTLPRQGRGGAPRFGVLDMMGRLEVTDPSAFLTQLAMGFGRAKAFGCGLMLIRRA